MPALLLLLAVSFVLYRGRDKSSGDKLAVRSKQQVIRYRTVEEERREESKKTKEECLAQKVTVKNVLVIEESFTGRNTFRADG